MSTFYTNIHCQKPTIEKQTQLLTAKCKNISHRKHLKEIKDRFSKYTSLSEL